MTVDATPVGSLARDLREARVDVWVVEQRVDEFLESLFPGWHARFPTRMGWRFRPPATIDVYDAVPSPAAADALQRAGFRTAILHDHDAAKFLTCTCQTWEAP
jgi:hypothetical protein